MPNGSKDETKIYLQVENPDEENGQIDLLNVASQMAKKGKFYCYLAAIAVSVGVLLGLILIAGQYFKGKNSFAQAVISFQYDGIEQGLDPNGAAFDINKIKSPVVIEDALSDLSITDISTEDIRQNISIEGVIPEDAVERITVIKEMALEDASNYEKILDVTYFPSQYVVYLYKDNHMTGQETAEILNAVLESYRDYFLDTYANTAVLTVTANLINYQDYDYMESVDMVEDQIDIMQNYVSERRNDAPDFRSAQTGLSFGDIQTALSTIKKVDLANLSSFVESNMLTKDRKRLEEYLNYNIKEYTMELSNLQTQLSTLQSSIDSYQKDPVVIVSSQESTQQLEQKNAYYDTLVQKKLDISNSIARTNTDLNKTYNLLNSLEGFNNQSRQEDFDYADGILENIISTIAKWTTLIEETTQEYYSTTLFSNAYKISVPAQYKAAGGIISMAKNIIICVAAMLFIVFVIWGIDGLRMELTSMRIAKKKHTESENDKK